MDIKVQSWVLVEHLFDAAVGPERLGELIAAWDAQTGLNESGPARLMESAGAGFAQQIAAALRLLEQLKAAEFRWVNERLASMLGAAMLLAKDGSVVAANEAAAAAFGLRSGGSIWSMPLERVDLDELSAQISEVTAGSGCEAILRLRLAGRDRAVLVHLKAIRGGTGHSHVLAVTSEVAWSDFTGFCLSPVRETEGDGVTVCRPTEAEFWSVYGFHRDAGEWQIVHDAEARDMGEALARIAETTFQRIEYRDPDHACADTRPSGLCELIAQRLSDERAAPGHPLAAIRAEIVAERGV